ncbi:MAG TPA: TetR/AcrR family transcriptional regulator [Azospirillaceae bacterium]|nr:TetR/AcrR family transcriptional regulator [Azospirillaceae bacterium]
MDKKVSADSAEVPRRRGRPRAIVQAPTEISPREEILRAAATLFATQGFAATTTRQIAEAVGIRQPSLFTHFENKQQIFETLVTGLITATGRIYELVLARWGSARPMVLLYALFRADIHYLATDPYRVGAFTSVRELEAAGFTPLIEERKRGLTLYRSVVERGGEAGEFAYGDLEIASNLVYTMTESVITWSEQALQRPAALLATEAADLMLRALLRRPADLDVVKRLLAKQGDQFPTGI